MVCGWFLVYRYVELVGVRNQLVTSYCWKAPNFVAPQLTNVLRKLFLSKYQILPLWNHEYRLSLKGYPSLEHVSNQDYYLIGGIPTSQKHMSSSVGIGVHN